MFWEGGVDSLRGAYRCKKGLDSGSAVYSSGKGGTLGERVYIDFAESVVYNCRKGGIF